MTKEAGKKKKKRSRFWGCLGSLIWWSFLLVLTVCLASAVAGYIVINDCAKGLPDVSRLRHYEPAETTRIYSTDGQIIATLFKENRTWMDLDKISPNMRNAIIAIEDSRFREHNGIDPIGVIRAAVDMARSHGEIHQGASTITMQVARNFFLTPDQSFRRKIREALLALQIERVFTKDEILEFYLNQVYFGSGAYGVQAAASTYFGTSADKLSILQSAIIAGLPASPSYYSPLVDERACTMRTISVLGRMLECDMIDYNKYRACIEQLKKGVKYANKGRKEFQVLKVPYFTTYVLKELYKRYDEDTLYRGGLKIYTTVDLKMQAEAEKIVRENIARNKDWYNASNAAAVVIENKTGYIKAMVGGAGWSDKNQFNRAWQARRQPGSSFKTIVYATAIESGYSQNSVVPDQPVSYRDGTGEAWSPKNSDGTFMGNITLRTALQYSRNVVAVRLLTLVGADRVIEYAYRLGIKERLEPNLSLALGSCTVSPLEMATVFTCFPNGGIKIQPSGIKIIYDGEGNVVEDNTYPRREEVLSESTAYTMCSMLRNAVENGTGGGALIPGRPVGGKTGTTDEHRDAWFCGFTAQYTAAVWVGNDNYSRMWSAFGGDVAAPIWKSIMLYVHRGLPVKEFGVAQNGQVSVLMCSQSKERACAGCKVTYKEYFTPGSVPTRFCHIHSTGQESMILEKPKDSYSGKKKQTADSKKEKEAENKETAGENPPSEEPTAVPVNPDEQPFPSIDPLSPQGEAPAYGNDNPSAPLPSDSGYSEPPPAPDPAPAAGVPSESQGGGGGYEEPPAALPPAPVETEPAAPPPEQVDTGAPPPPDSVF
ncbi:MAG: PBP1A family penicillin-binding protein [bacterium]|nr:PBP1A family penicillin-binding protein [bacterium]